MEQHLGECFDGVISGVTEWEDYPDGVLAGGEVIIKAGDGK